MKRKIRPNNRASTLSVILLLTFALGVFAVGCASEPVLPQGFARTVLSQSQWGIYALHLATGGVKLVYASPTEMHGSALRLEASGQRFVFAARIEGQDDSHLEICTVGVGGAGFSRLTSNGVMDVYPAWAWSPDGTRIAFLSIRRGYLDIWMMDSDGGNPRLLYDSGSHDADVDWGRDSLVFTSGFAIWKVGDGGRGATQLTRPAGAGTWGNANLPLGDYDPKLSPDGSKVVFERLTDTSTTHGSYDIFVVNTDGTGETRLTSTGYAQGRPDWSNSGDSIVYTVAAIGSEGKYDLYVMNADGSNNRNVTPAYFPNGFLCHAAVFSPDDTVLYFIGQWWQ